MFSATCFSSFNCALVASCWYLRVLRLVSEIDDASLLVFVGVDGPTFLGALVQLIRRQGRIGRLLLFRGRRPGLEARLLEQRLLGVGLHGRTAGERYERTNGGDERAEEQG